MTCDVLIQKYSENFVATFANKYGWVECRHAMGTMGRAAWSSDGL